MHLLLSGNDSVPLSLWHGRGMHSTECLLVTSFLGGVHSIVMSMSVHLFLSVCLSGCLSVKHNSKTALPIITKFLRLLCIAVARSYGSIAMRYVLTVM